MPKFSYPSARRDDTKEVIHGIEMTDPYRWLEDGDSRETQAFAEQQNAVFRTYVESCVYRNQIRERVNTLCDYRRYGCPFKRGNNFYLFMNNGLQNQNVLYTMEALDAKPRVFIDPNEFSEDGNTSMPVSTFSEDGLWFAYGMSSGSDWLRVRVRNVTTGEDSPEELTKLKFTNISWTHDNKGFFYASYPDHSLDATLNTQTSHQKLFYHRVGTDQSEDILVVQYKDKPSYKLHQVRVSDCGRYLILFPTDVLNSLWLVADLTTQAIESELKLTPIVNELTDEYEYITNDNDIFYMKTNKNALNYRVVAVDLKRPSPDNWVDIVKEHPKDCLAWCQMANNDVLILCYLRDVSNVLEMRRLSDGSFIRNLDLPIGSITGFSAKRTHNEIYYYFTTFLTPGITYRYDFVNEPEVIREVKVADFDPSLYETKQIFYESKDGTRVPMFIVHRKGIELNGDNACLLFGYGGYGFCLQPFFSAQRLLLLDNLNGIFAVANIRGGGEYGDEWHRAGQLLRKQNSYDDFAAAAEYLIDSRYTCADKLTIQGASNGGLLVSAMVVQRPDLFGCGIAQVGSHDMLRFHKFTVGAAWCFEFGSPEEELHFKNILKYSPLHNIPDKCDRFPATLVTTADHDDRVVPLHSYKFIAQLQHSLGATNDRPLMVRVETDSGHGLGKSTAKSIEELVDIYCFMISGLQLKYRH